MKIGIGIDTGGTYTDAIIYNFDDKSILASAKSLTTKNDLSIGILGAIDALPIDLARQAEVISLSTTLATNACVEDKGGQAKLIFFGANKKVLEQYGEEYGLPPMSEIYLQESHSTYTDGLKKEPDWELFADAIESGFEDCDGVGIIEMNAMRNGAVVEKKAKTIFQARHNIPVVCAHELFAELNCLQRGASTLLNAGLFPVIKEFLEAVKLSLARRDIHATLVIMRSDGSLMSEKFASYRPVETLLSGPAASAMGGAQLSDSANSIIVDMGGTTTDIAVIKDGAPVTVVDGVSIGRWKTFVDGLYVKTFGLGGDTAIHYSGKGIYLEDYRVIPLCVAAADYPVVLENLKEIAENKRNHTMFLYEHLMLVKDISQSTRYTDEEKALCAALKKQPLLISQAAEAIGRDIYTLDAKRLIKDGVVQICGLTPTDIMHIRGDFGSYCTEASMLGAEFAAFNLDISVEQFCEKVYTEIKRKLYLNIVKVLFENKYPHYMKNGVNKDVESFINESYEAVRTGNRDPLISYMLKTEYSLIGIGAPIHIFLGDVAKMLGTEVILPEFHQVANALGAIIGSVSASRSIEVRPNSGSEGIIGYTVFGNDGNRVFEEVEAAVEFAVSEAKDGAKAEALLRGAKGKLTLSVDINEEQADARDCTIYLGTVVTARAVGAVGF